jgi:hypothetical protein
MFGTPKTDFRMADAVAEAAKSPADCITYLKLYFAKSALSNGTYIWMPSRRRVEFMKKGDFVDTYLPADLCNLSLAAGKPVVWKAREWWNSTANDELFSIACEPGKPRVYTLPGGNPVINQFPGFLHTEVKPYAEYPEEVRARVSAIVRHIREVWASDVDEVHQYVMRWFANCCVGAKNESLLYARDNGGTGKSIVTSFLREKVLGESIVLETDNPDVILGNFNGELLGKVLCVLEEAPTQTKGQFLSLNNALKQKITGKTLEIREKYKETVFVRSCLNLIMLTNNPAMTINHHDRRCVVLDISPKYRGNFEYFTQLSEAMEAEGTGEAFAALLHELARQPFTGRVLPKTERAKEEMVEALDPVLVHVKQAFLAQKKGIDMAFGQFYHGLPAEVQAKRSKIAVGRTLEANGIEKKRKRVGDSTALWVKASYEELLAHFSSHNYIHETDGIALE